MSPVSVSLPSLASSWSVPSLVTHHVPDTERDGVRGDDEQDAGSPLMELTVKRDRVPDSTINGWLNSKEDQCHSR